MPLIPALLRQRQVDHFEFRLTWSIESSMAASATLRPVSKKERKPKGALGSKMLKQMYPFADLRLSPKCSPLADLRLSPECSPWVCALALS